MCNSSAIPWFGEGMMVLSTLKPTGNTLMITSQTRRESLLIVSYNQSYIAPTNADAISSHTVDDIEYHTIQRLQAVHDVPSHEVDATFALSRGSVELTNL